MNKQEYLMKCLGYKKIGSGYLHNVYRKKDVIYKCMKIPCDYSKQYMKFKNEIKALKLLQINDFPGIYTYGIECNILPNTCFLVEKLALGQNYTMETITEGKINILFNYMMRIANTKMPYFGDLQYIKSSKTSWINYIKKKMVGFDKINSKYQFNITENDLISWVECHINYPIYPGYLIMDAKPDNFFWENDRISNIIDIDHPIFGDSILQLACISYEWKELSAKFVEHYIEEHCVNKDVYIFYLIFISIIDLKLQYRINEIDDTTVKRLGYYIDSLNSGGII